MSLNLIHIDEKTKCLVYGYIRNQQKDLSLDHNNNPFYTIPELVIYKCVLYYYITDYFEIGGITGTIYSVKNYNDTISHCTNRHCNFYGYVSIVSTSKAIHRWKFKINEQHTINNICIGIEEYKQNDKEHNNRKLEKDYYFCLTDETINYGYHDNAGVYSKGKRKIYGTTYGEGTVIEMKLDLHKTTLSFTQNNNDFGVAYDNIQQQEGLVYKMAVLIAYSSQKRQTVTLLSYNCSYPESNM
eukprot:378482_1